MIIRAWVALLALVLVLALAGCGSKTTQTAAPQAGAATNLKLSAKDNKYTPTILEAKAGQTVRLEISDIATPHTFTISPFRVNEAVTKIGTQTVQFAVPATASGPVEFFCSIHVGMGGMLQVKP